MRLASAVTMIGISVMQHAAAEPAGYRFAFLGDFHFDRLEHHDMDWVRNTHPRDIRQIENYSRITEQHGGALLKAVSQTLEQGGESAFAIIQAGDFVEGLCGRYELQKRQFEEAIHFVESNGAPFPFLMTKGNHEITGPGAAEAYADTMLPWLSMQADSAIDNTSYTVRQGGDLLVFFDGYRPDLDWLEAVLKERPFRHLFFIVHEPVVPYNARSQWHLFARDEAPERRERLLSLLGKHHAIVLCGHLHHYSAIRRRTGTGSFVQLSMNSVMDLRPDSGEWIEGTDRYGPELVALEPDFSPDTRPARREILLREKPAIGFFELSRMPGWGMISVSDEQIRLDIHKRCETNAWRSLIIQIDGLDLSIIEKGDAVYLDMTSPPGLLQADTRLVIDTDYFGIRRDSQNPAPGPIEDINSAKVRLTVWPQGRGRN